MGYFSQLETLIDEFNDPSRSILVPFQFFYDLYREQECEVYKLAQRVKEAENLSEKLLQESIKKKKQADQGFLIDGDLE